MNSTAKSTVVVFLGAMLCCMQSLLAQVASQSPAAPDTMRIIEILQGKSLREKNIDSLNSLQTIAGNVILKEGLTLFYCDSAAINKRTNIVEAFGNVHINQNDSIHTYSQYLKYVGKERMAYLRKEVKLTDGKGVLYTQELEYDLKSSIGKYFKGGRVINGKTVLTSTEGVYYADTKDVFFKKNVHLVDPKYDVRNDTLLYNIQTQITSWNTPTIIRSQNGGDVYSTNGSYDLKNGKAFFGSRTIIKDSARTYVADNTAIDDSTGMAQLEGNAVIKDSTNGYSILGRSIFLDKKNNSFLATGKPVLIFKGEGSDSTFVAADTLFSGVEKRDSLGRKISVSRDTLKKDSVVHVPDSLLARASGSDSLKNLVSEQRKDSLLMTSNREDATNKDSLTNIAMARNKHASDSVSNIIATVPTAIPAKEDSLLMARRDTVFDQPARIIELHKDSIRNTHIDADSSAHLAIRKDSLADSTAARATKDTAIRYFIAFHHVRIFNDSLQSVCDSLYYSSEDSVFRLFHEPLVFSNNSKIAGDTIYMYTKHQKPERLYVFENGIIINKANEQMYNQMAGRTLNGYFKGGELDYVRAKGSPAESIYYPQDEDSAYIGMNRGKGDVIDIYFLNKEIHKVKFVNNVDGTMFPLRQIPADQKYLKNYRWEDQRRPKNKLELFE